MTLLMVLILALCLWSLWGFFSSQVEQAEYSVVEKRDDYEIRAYPAHIVAQTTIEGPRGVAMNAGFRIVAGYIFGDNTRKESIAMTAPVVVTAEGDSQTISFGMPAGPEYANQPLDVQPGTVSETVGVLGHSETLDLFEIASKRIAPERICGAGPLTPSTEVITWPPIKSVLI